MYYIGLMSGTSMDAVDVALVKFTNNKAALECYREYPIEQALRQKIRLINEKSSLEDIAALDVELGQLFANAVNRLLAEADVAANKVTAIGSHGQTVLHIPNDNHRTSIQIADPNIISAETNITTVADFRRMDMAFGGQGAPLASAFHQYQFQRDDKNSVILNIGGMANITLLSGSDVIGFDTGPGNALLDDWTQINLNKEYDKNGEWAKQGVTDPNLLELMLSDKYFNLPYPKSTGREYFNISWLKKYLANVKKDISPKDIQATLLQLSAITICTAIKHLEVTVDEILACGGGAYNLRLMDTLESLLEENTSLTTTAKYGLSPDCIEAVTFAWLAKQRVENIPANLPSVTGAKRKVLLGGIYSSK